MADQENATSGPRVARLGEDVAQAELRQAWRTSPERSKWIRQSIGVAALLVIIAAAVGGAIAGLSYDPSVSVFGSRAQNVAAYIGIGIGMAILFAVYAAQFLRLHQRRAFRDRHILSRARVELDEAEDEVREQSDDTSFTTLWIATQKRLDYYHEIATSQSQRSFAYGQAAAGAGLLIVLVCTVLAIFADSAAGAASAGVLGGSGAALAGYIGATFLRTQDLASQQLRAYFGQPLEFSRFLSAERLIADLASDDRREEAMLVLIRAIAKEPEGEA